jgi:hypothetical protein
MFDNNAMIGVEERLSAMQGTPDGLGDYGPGMPGLDEVPQAQVPAVPSYGRPLPARVGQPGLVSYPPPMMPPGPVAGQTFQWLEPSTTDNSAVLRSAGVSAVFLVGSFAVGVALGGPWGAAAGVMLAGTAMNAYRAQKDWGSQDPSKNYEAVSSAVFAGGGLLVGGYAAYRAYQAKQKKDHV